MARALSSAGASLFGVPVSSSTAERCKQLSPSRPVFCAPWPSARAPRDSQLKLTTLFTSDNGGSVGGIVYFDVKVTNTIRLTDLETNYSATASTGVGIQVWRTKTANTYVGNETNQAAWQQIGGR